MYLIVIPLVPAKLAGSSGHLDSVSIRRAYLFERSPRGKVAELRVAHFGHPEQNQPLTASGFPGEWQLLPPWGGSLPQPLRAE